MYRIGIIGSDNTHALAFSRLCNIPDENGKYLYNDVRVTAICGDGDDASHTVEIARKANIESIVDAPSDMYGKVDAVMVVHRHGNKHIPCAIDFIKRGYPIWIDKPISSSLDDIETFKLVCQEYNPLVMGGSTLKFNDDVLKAKMKIENASLGNVYGGTLNFLGSLDSEYDGLFFYGPHLIEEVLTIFGYDVKSIQAFRISDTEISVIMKYADYIVNMNYLNNVHDYFITVYGSENSFTSKIDISNIYKCGLDEFIKMIKFQKAPQTIDELVKSVYIIDAIYKSLNNKVEIVIENGGI